MCVAQFPVVRLVSLYRDAAFVMPAHQCHVVRDALTQGERPAPVDDVEPEQRRGAPSVANRASQDLGVAQQVTGARIGAHKRIVAPPAGRVEPFQVGGAAKGHAPCACATGIDPFRMKEILLRVLVRTKRDHV